MVLLIEKEYIMSIMRHVVLSLAVFALLCSVSLAHSQLIYSPEGVISSSKLPLKLIFTHPFSAGHTMNMGADQDGKAIIPLKFGVMVQKGEGEPVLTDLRAELKPMDFASLENSGIGYELEYKARGMGDFVFFCDPNPYYEEKVDSYIENITKVIFNKGGAMTCVFEDVPGLKVQIKPLVRPYALWTGNVFRGIVEKWDEKTESYVPVPFVKVGVTYINHKIDMENNKFEEAAIVTPPNDACATQAVLTNENGEFSYSIPESGWWGFSAIIGVGGEYTYNEKPLYLCASIWAYAYDMEK